VHTHVPRMMHGINQSDVRSPKACRKVVIFVDFVGVEGKGVGGEPSELCNHLYLSSFIYNYKNSRTSICLN
jgi:hypothetical protein